MLVRGADAAREIDAETAAAAAELSAEGKPAKLAIIRMGAKPDDVYYEKSAVKRAGALGILTASVELKETASQREIEEAVERCSMDDTINGILLLRPLAGHIDEKAVIAGLDPKKDVDGITPLSMAGVFMGEKDVFAPCTAEACVRMLEHCGVELSGKNAVVIGRSLVVGKPLSMLLLGKNATVTVCHTHTRDLKNICRGADILIAAAGRAKMVDADYVSPGQTVIDVGINMDENGRMVGDVDMESVEPKCGMLTPVPGGVGSLTTSILLSNVVRAARGVRRV